MDAYAPLHHACAALGTRLFTISIVDGAAGLTRRAYTSHPVEYPLSGTKPMPKDGWYDHCIAARQVFIANTAPEFARYFFDHALIVSLGLGSCVNLPVTAGEEVRGTVNLLAEAGHFTEDKLAAYQALVTGVEPALRAALLQEETSP